MVSAVSLPGLNLPEPAKKEPELPEIAAAPPRAEHPLVLLLRELNPDELSPLDALRMLMEWKKLWSDGPESTAQDADDEPPHEDAHE